MNLNDPFLLQVAIGALGAVSIVIAFLEILTDLGKEKKPKAKSKLVKPGEVEAKAEVAETPLPEPEPLAEQATPLQEFPDSVQEPDVKAAPEPELKAEVEEKPEPEPKVAEKPKELKDGLKKTRRGLLSRFTALFSKEEAKEIGAILDALQDVLVLSDVGINTSKLVVDELRAKDLEANKEAIRSSLSSELVSILGGSTAEDLNHQKAGSEPRVILVVGVNGSGKTTSIAKLAKRLRDKGSNVVMAAGDTFRAAAVQQLQTWGERLGVTVVAGAEGAKPSTIAFEGVKQAKESGADVLIIDTAGRLHTRTNLMKELESVVGIIGRELPGAPHETLLVVDGTSGQNALVQAREFSEAANLTGVVVTKLDGTPKGGVVVSIKQELGIPVRFIGVGEKPEDLRLFEPKEFVAALLEGEEDIEPLEEEPKSEPVKRVARRRRQA